MSYGTINADVIGTSVANSSLGAGNSSAMKNRIINGDFRIDQRNAGASVTPTASGYTLDRWRAGVSVTSKFSVQQNAGSVTPPNGFINYLGVTSLSAYTVGASEQFNIGQRIEGYNVADLAWGTANAKTVTLSFWVYSSLTGAFGGAIRNDAGNRSYPFSYTISSANTWEQKTITVVGDTTGTWVTSNGTGVQIIFSLGSGSTLSGTAGAWSAGNYVSATGATSVVGTNGATFYLTGVQLEVGSSATGFEYRQYQQELALCQRYYQKLSNFDYVSAFCFSTNRVLSGIPYTSPMRTAPTATAASNSFVFYLANAAYFSSAVSAVPNSTGFVALDVTVAASAGASGIGSVQSGIQLSAEL